MVIYTLRDCSERVSYKFRKKKLRTFNKHSNTIDKVLICVIFAVTSSRTRKWLLKLPHKPIRIVSELGYHTPCQGLSSCKYSEVFLEALMQSAHGI